MAFEEQFGRQEHKKAVMPLQSDLSFEEMIARYNRTVAPAARVALMPHSLHTLCITGSTLILRELRTALAQYGIIALAGVAREFAPNGQRVHVLRVTNEWPILEVDRLAFRNALSDLAHRGDAQRMT